jgi:acylpyruvate hydrolase
MVEIEGHVDVGSLLRRGSVESAVRASGLTHSLDGADFAPVVLQPGKVICVGLNYRAHIAEMKHEMPEHPTLFAKFADSLAGAHDDILIPPESDFVDWEGELAVILGRSIRRARGAEALSAIAGYAIADDVSMRDWQYRTQQWLQGKAWSNSTPLGPMLVTPDEMPDSGVIVTRVDGVEKQRGEIHDLVHDAPKLIEYVSTFTRLDPGDVILTGTPSGVGHARDPRESLRPGSIVEVAIDGIGTITNRFVAEGL